MGLMGRVFGAGAAVKDVGEAVGGVAEVLVGNQSERDANAHARYVESVGQFGAEFAAPGNGSFHDFMDGLNRLPRPMLAIGTLGLFVYAMMEPYGFAMRMEGLALVPQPLWWLLGAIVSFYFGARELHYQRFRKGVRHRVMREVGKRIAPDQSIAPPQPSQQTNPPSTPIKPPAPGKRPGVVKVDASDPGHNAAVEEWRMTQQ